MFSRTVNIASAFAAPRQRNAMHFSKRTTRPRTAALGKPSGSLSQPCWAMRKTCRKLPPRLARSRNLRKNCCEPLWPCRAYLRLLSNIFFLFLFISFILQPGKRETQLCLRTRFARDTSGRSRLLMFPKQIVSHGNIVRILLFAAVLVGLAACKPASKDEAAKDQAPKDQAITYTADPNASKRMTLLLQYFAPKSMLHAAVHEVPRAKFPVIDVHNHVNDAAGINGAEIPPAEVVRRMDAANVQKIVILTGMWGDKLQAVIDKIVKPYPYRVMVFTH